MEWLKQNKISLNQNTLKSIQGRTFDDRTVSQRTF